MSLRWYRMPRLVVLSANASVLEAARAIESNDIGAVVVQDQGRVIGIATDRDLTIRVVGQGLDPKTTPLSAVMTSPVATLTPKDNVIDAIGLMQQRGIRRVPLVEDGRPVGIVTLDDLLLDETAALDYVIGIIESQLGTGGPAPSPRLPAAQRGAARAQATYGRLRNQVRVDTKLETSERAETALKVVVESLVRRLTPGEAKDFIAQLPSLLQPGLRALPPGPDKLITREAIEAELIKRLGVNAQRAEQLLASVGATITRIVSPGQIDDMRGQLPPELRVILSDD